LDEPQTRLPRQRKTGGPDRQCMLLSCDMVGTRGGRKVDA
jgi:hypothetical protein